MKSAPVRKFLLPWIALCGIGAAAEVKLEHPDFIATLNDNNGKAGFSIVEKSTGTPVVQNGILFPGAKPLSPPSVSSITDSVFGKGRRALITVEGGTVSLDAYPSLPFVLVRSSLKNIGATDTDTASKEVATYTYNAPAAGLKTSGTGGLLDPGKNPGSYLFLACADPATRKGIVSGWITQKRGSGTVFSAVDGGKTNFKAQLEHGHLILKPGQSSVLDTFAIGVFPDARIGLEKFSDAIAKAHAIKLRPKTAVYCSWYAEGPGHGKAGTPATTIELAKFIKDQRLKEYGLGVIQLDDFWQDGPMMGGPSSEFSRVNPGGPYKDGIAPVAKQVKENGVDFGLWWLPFGRNHMQPDYKDKQDWFVKKPDGTPLRQKSFGGSCLDSTNPAVREHLKDLSSVIAGWGVDYFKMDGLSAGAGVDHVYINDSYKNDMLSGCLPLHDPSKTNIEAARMGMEAIRSGAGKNVFFSACCAVQNMRIYAGTIGLVDSMRVGPDFNHDGQGIRSGPLRGSWMYFLNGKVWWNDPDPTKVRDNNQNSEGDSAMNGAVTLDQARMTSSWVSVTNQFFLISDWLPNLPAERMDILKRTMAVHHGTARPVDYFDNNLANTWHVSDESSGVRRDLIGVFNFHPKPLKVSHALDKAGLIAGKTYHAFDFWAGKRLPDASGEIKAGLAPNSCQVIALRASEGRPLLISTSRHVTQGMVDVKKEIWNNNKLSGVSQVIGADPYELRIIVPEGYTAGEVKLSTGEKPEVSNEPGLLRVKFTPAKSGTANWSVAFTKA
ncbi:MAG: hypothetical protein V4733_05345 [Verrucomicrobiota bacterium]